MRWLDIALDIVVETTLAMAMASGKIQFLSLTVIAIDSMVIIDWIDETSIRKKEMKLSNNIRCCLVEWFSDKFLSRIRVSCRVLCYVPF